MGLFVRGHGPLYVALLLEPGADCLEGAISTAPAVVIRVILHVVVIAVGSLDQVHLENAHTSDKITISKHSATQYPSSKEEME